MRDSSHRVTIAVAIIGVVGTLGAALIGSWDKIFPPPPQASIAPQPLPSTTQPSASAPAQPARPAEPAPPARAPAQPPRAAAPAQRPADVPTQPVRTVDPAPQIAGLWRDSDNPNNGTKIQQDGDSFQFTRWGVLQDGVRFESSGTGALRGSRIAIRYVARYQTGSTSSGECAGSVLPGERLIELSCADSLYGRFVTVANRV